MNRFGKPVHYKTGPVIFGEPGTSRQHSFYQLLHQGTDIVPLQFIGFEESQYGKDITVEGSTSQQKLLANVVAQITAFACGKQDDNANKSFAGGRPSSLIHGKALTPEALGALLAHYENKVMFQGFIWNVNSFDQEGVQLGKVLAKKFYRTICRPNSPPTPASSDYNRLRELSQPVCSRSYPPSSSKGQLTVNSSADRRSRVCFFRTLQCGKVFADKHAP